MANRSTYALLALHTSLLALAACGHAEPPRAEPPRVAPRAQQAEAPAAMLDALFSGQRMTRPIADLLAGVELEPEEGFRIVELGRDAYSSHHLVALRDAEPLHEHEAHDLLVFVLRGHGRMLIGDEERAIGERSIVFVPRGATHAMRNLSGEPLAGYAVFVPAFDGQDRVLVDPAER